MSAVLIVFTDGRRDCIELAIPSLEEHIHGPVSRKVIHDDSADPDYRDWLVGKFADYEVIGTECRAGFGGAYANAWRWLSDEATEPYVFSTEDDFVLTRDVELADMMFVLALRPDLQQLALRRQPWNVEEAQAGGIVEMHPEDYTDMVAAHQPWKWLEHRRHWTTNPSLHRRGICARGWPNIEHSEGHFSIELFQQDPRATCGYWGGRDSGEWCRHVGNVRVGTGY